MTTTVTTTTQLTVAPARPRVTIPPALRHLLRSLTRRVPDTSAPSSVRPPVGGPGELSPGTTGAAPSYSRGAAVWAYIAAAWLPARVIEIDGNSVLVTYQVPGTGEKSLEVVHRTHIAPRGGTSTAGAEASPLASENAGQAQATLLMHHADEHGMCMGCADLAHFCWAPCPAARDAMRILDDGSAQLAGAR